METKESPLTIYECPSGHRIFRMTERTGTCSRCGGVPFKKIASVTREPEETDMHWQLRALRVKGSHAPA